MVFGYTPFDPVVVLLGTIYAAYILTTRPVRLMGFLPLALSLYFFVPLVSYLTLWRTVPLLLLGRLLYVGRLRLSAAARPFFGALVILFGASLAYAIAYGADTERAVIRGIYYLSAIALFLFSYEMGRKQEGYELFVRGFVWVGILYAAYGVYQILAFYTGLPVRGIVYGPNSSGLIPVEGGIPRINSLANEPKRLGYVLFLAAMACVTLGLEQIGKTRLRYMVAAISIFLISVMTFSGSYFLAIALFAACATLLYPAKLLRFSLVGLLIAGMLSAVQPENRIISVIEDGIERRSAEVERGLDGAVVYRQEFFANDYLARHPKQALTGVGVGQYYRVLNRFYGTGVGYNERGALAPLNSTLLELTLDLSGVAAIIFYFGIAALILQLRRRRFHFLALALLFLALQSLTITTLLYMSAVAGVALGQVSTAGSLRRSGRRASHGGVSPVRQVGAERA